jgi:hypothetical protein
MISTHDQHSWPNRRSGAGIGAVNGGVRLHVGPLPGSTDACRDDGKIVPNASIDRAVEERIVRFVIASVAKQSSLFLAGTAAIGAENSPFDAARAGLLPRCVPRNDDLRLSTAC